MPNYEKAFESHSMRRVVGQTWRCQKPRTWCYGFRVTWTPGALILTGDVGDMIVNHYSFGDPWAAAAWVRGADWGYFMEKSQYNKEYCPNLTAQVIVEQAYQRIKWDSDDIRIFENAGHVLMNCYGDANTADGRKQIAREILSCGEGECLEAQEAIEITGDFEACMMAYPAKHRWEFEAIKWWAEEMWKSEPAWHWCLRMYRRYREKARRYFKLRPWEKPATQAR